MEDLIRACSIYFHD